MPRPREADLPYAAHLAPFTGPLSRESDLDTVRITETDFESAEAGSSRFTESVLSQVSFTDSRLRRARFNDVWMHSTRWTACDLAETNWLDVEVQSGILTGVESWDADMCRVAFFWSWARPWRRGSASR